MVTIYEEFASNSDGILKTAGLKLCFYWLFLDRFCSWLPLV